jgi:hypothetical protein
MDVNLAPTGKCVHYRNTYAMKAAGYLIGVLVELTSCMETRHNELKGADIFRRMHAHGDTSPVVFNANDIVFFQYHYDIGTEPLKRLVYGVIYDFINKVMKPIETGGPNIHAWAFAYRFQALEDLDALSRIA